MIILAIFTGIFGITLLGIMLIALILDITRTSNKALEEHYKRNKK
jgi:hypothetical protein